MTDKEDFRATGTNPYGQTDSNEATAVAEPAFNEPQSVYNKPYSPCAGVSTPVTTSVTHNVSSPSPYSDNTFTSDNVAPSPQSAPSSRWEFTALQKGFAFFAIVLGYLFNRFIFCGHAPGLGALVFFEIATISACIFLVREGAGLRFGHYVWMGLLMVFPVSFILTDNPVLKGFGALFMTVALMYWINISAKGTSLFRHTFLSDSVGAVFVAPFKNFVSLPVALFKPTRGSKNKTLRYVLIGLVITIPFTAVICTLLISSDETFKNLMELNNISEHMGDFVSRLFSAIPVAMIIFSLFISSTRDKQKVKKAKVNTGGKINHIVFITAYIPVLLVYIMFFVSQFAYFTGAFSAILPEDLTYAEYARQGFFELCAVVAINLLVVLLTERLCKRNQQHSLSVGIKAVVTLLSLFSLMLVAIFTAKMIMYTDAYGLTHKRIFTLWFTLVLLFVVIMTLIKVFAPKFRFYSVVVTGCVLLFALISFANVDAIIAKYNVEWYQQGKISWMGEEALYELDHSAVKYLDALVEDETMVLNEIDAEYQYYYYTYDETYESVGYQIKQYYQYLYSYDNGIIGYSVPVSEAREIFDQRGIQPFKEWEEDYSASL